MMSDYGQLIHNVTLLRPLFRCSRSMDHTVNPTSTIVIDIMKYKDTGRGNV